MSSVVRSDHKAVVAHTDNNKSAGPKKTSTLLVFRTKAPEQHALFLQTASDINVDFIQTEDDVQTQFDTFYNAALQLLDYFYQQHIITVTVTAPIGCGACVRTNIAQDFFKQNKFIKINKEN